MADEELDLNHDGVVAGDASFGVRKDIALKLKPSPSKGKRGRKPSKHKKDETREDTPRQSQGEYGEEEVQLPTMKGPSEPQHKNKKLRWDHKVHLIGEKVLDPLIHCCETCTLPILIYGRMIPCKHVFCFDCAKKTEKKCPRCHDGVQRIEQAALGTVFMCTHGGAKHGVSGCRRTYLSNRDLQAHIQYRHMREQSQTGGVAPQLTSQPQQQPPPPQQTAILHQRQDYPPIHNTAVASSSMVGMTTIPPPQLGQQSQQQPVAGNRPMGYHGNQDSVQQQQHLGQAPPPLSLPQTFTSPPPPTPVQGATLGQGPPPQQPVVMQPQGYSQPPPSTIESYHTIPIMSQMAPGAAAAAGRTGNLITIPIQEERGGYSGGQGLPMSQPPPNYPPPANVPPHGYPAVSFSGSGGPQQPPAPPHHTGPPPHGVPGHLPPRPGGGGGPPPPVSTHAGIPPRFGPGQTPPYSQQQSAPGGPRPWQGPGPGGPPPRGPPPPCGPGVRPSRY